MKKNSKKIFEENYSWASEVEGFLLKTSDKRIFQREGGKYASMVKKNEEISALGYCSPDFEEMKQKVNHFEINLCF